MQDDECKVGAKVIAQYGNYKGDTGCITRVNRNISGAVSSYCVRNDFGFTKKLYCLIDFDLLK